MPATTVLGAGIVGASIAYHLARAGQAVTVLEKALPGTGATAHSFAWIGRGPEAASPAQAALRRTVLEDYRRLAAEVPGVHVTWSGSLGWGAQHAQHLPGARDQRVLTGEEVAQLEPALRTAPPEALLTTTDGALDPAAVIEALLAAARSHGATLTTGVAAHRLRVSDGEVVGVETSEGLVTSSTAVIATGADAPVLCAAVGFDLPVAPSPAVLMRFTAAPQVVRTLVYNDEIEVRQAADGTLIAAWAHEGQTTPGELRQAGEAMLDRLRSAFTGVDAVELVSVRVGMRPMPADGSPVIGPVPGVRGAYLAVMHSGVTLAASVGRLVATEIVDGVQAEQLASLRPARLGDDTSS